MYQIGDKIVHPMHGAGVVEDIVTQNVSGTAMDYYLLRLPTGSVTVMIPVSTCDSIGIRPIISSEEALTLLSSIDDIVCEDESNWNRRYRENMDRIKSGNLTEVACVIKSLTARELRKPLSTGERKMLVSAKQILYSELRLAMDCAESELDERIRISVSK